MAHIHQIAVLTSGHSRGSNLQAINDYFFAHQLPVQIAFAVKTKADAPVSEVCRQNRITCIYLPCNDMKQFERNVLTLIREYRIELIALAGFLKLLSPGFLEQAGIPVLNIHPALLPKYGGKGMFGMAVHQAVWTAKERYSGVTIHLVDPVYDHGKILAQLKVDISKCGSAEDVARSVLKIEHSLYGKTIWEYLSSLQP